MNDRAEHGRNPAGTTSTSAAQPAIAVANSLDVVPAAQWNALTGDHPFLRHEFLSALHETGCATAATGWAPQFLLLHEGAALVGAMPLYLKSHSYGEYVFDWAWADAYRRHRLNYYPKLLCAVPFTPVSGPRVLAATAQRRRLLVQAALALAREAGASSLHCLFPPPAEAGEMRQLGMLIRRGVQFHWTHRGYSGFDAFLAEFTHDRRKKIKQERRRVRDAGFEFEWLTGAAVTPELWEFFTRCYRTTYRLHRSTPYLNLDFFRRIGATLPDSVVLILARRAGRPIAAALNLRNSQRLYGRYWGAAEHHPGLHFETCYYQAIEYCIAHGIGTFEGGAQGEHKMARGLMPVATCSTHWLAHPGFAGAVEEFLGREADGIAHYLDELDERTPFRRAGASNPGKS